MFIQTVNPNINMSVKPFEEMTQKSVDASFEEMTVKSVDARVDKVHKVKVAFVDWKETIIKGFDKLPEAFIGLFEGKNRGKMLVETERFLLF